MPSAAERWGLDLMYATPGNECHWGRYPFHQAANARRAIYPERDSPADLAAASMRLNTLAGKVLLMRSAMSDRDAKSTATTDQIWNL